MPRLTISLLGGVKIALDGTAVSNFASRKADALFIYLACNPRPHPRETLATLFWPNNDQTRALANLSVILSSLRKQVDDFLLTDRHMVSFNTEATFWLDVVSFEQAIAATQKQQADKISRTIAAQLQTAVSHYKGDFLAGFNVRGVPEFEAWVLLEQERLRQMMLDALANLVSFHQQRSQFSEGIQVAQQLLALDPLQEEIHRQLMRLYALDNQRPAALAQYDQCTAILAEELGVEPDEETKQLFEEIRDDKVTNQENVTQAAAGSTPTHNLPTPTTKFIGRENELAHIENWLAEPNDRLLTIIGPGGMGKTRLAQEAARGQVNQFADGVWMVSLVPQTNFSEMITAVSETIGLTLSGQEAIATQLHNHLKPVEMLLILDNLEHLLSTELHNFLIQLTHDAPELRIITTSRERLNLQAERLLTLGGLPFPTIGERLSDNGLRLTDYPGIQLFSNRVQRIRAGFELEKEETAVIQLCQLVGGLPLALELAATWIRVLSVNEIVAEIKRELSALATTLRDVPERHRSLHAVIESSWQMLSTDEQTLFRKLAVFRGGLTRTAAQQIAKATLPQLMNLVDRSFLRLDDDQRFRRHPLMLQFAQEKLASQPGEQLQTEAMHASYFAKFVHSRESTLAGEDTQQALDEINTELENIRAAWQWSLQQMNAPLLNQVIESISRFFTDRSRYLEGADLFESALLAIEEWEETAVSEQLIAKMQVELGFYLYQTGQYAKAEKVLLEANTSTQKLGLNTARLNCLKHLGDVIADQGERDRARTILEEALQLCRKTEADDEIVEMTILNTLGNLEVSAGNYDTAQHHFDQAMDIAKALNHTLRIAILHNNIAIIANRQDNFEEALHQYQLARNKFVENNHAWGIAATTHNIGMIYADLERYEEALATIQEAYAAHEKIGHRRGMVGGLSFMGTIQFKLGKRREAGRNYYESLKMAQEVGVAWSAVATLVDVAELEMSYGRFEKAAELVAFAIQQETAEAVTLEKGQGLLEELKAELPYAWLEGMETAVADLTLDDIIAKLTN
ncbi:AfsR/SARP family transcriptional regulator [Candidatus Leptofilum sp.]|uniref:AfsR/SARP family transcriptional regulator n=1 Tax=Candidatus Leptofilum sp. TaxID=3241576 RepID=UPI003B598F43